MRRASTEDHEITGSDLARLVATLIIENPNEVFTGDIKGWLLSECSGAESLYLSPLERTLEGGSGPPPVQDILEAEKQFQARCTTEAISGKALNHVWRRACKVARKFFVVPLKQASWSQFQNEKEAALLRAKEYCKKTVDELEEAYGDVNTWKQLKQLKYDTCMSSFRWVAYLIAGLITLVALVFIGPVYSVIWIIVLLFCIIFAQWAVANVFDYIYAAAEVFSSVSASVLAGLGPALCDRAANSVE